MRIAFVERVRTFARKRAVRVVGIVLASLLGVGVVSAVGFHLACRGPGTPLPAYAPAQVQALEKANPDYKRAEASTFLTLPEWYEVFSYQEYADHIASERPSQFPYFHAIGQFWELYCFAYGHTSGSYPFDAGDHLMLVVIGTSFTAEYALKGAWEHTLGWATEWSSHSTPEDAYAAATAKEYGTYVETEPWYAYRFGDRAVHVWTDTSFFGPHFPRKIERKVFLTAQYGVEGGYAFVIRKSTELIYGDPPEWDHLWVANATPAALNVTGLVVEQDLGNGSYVVRLPHYQGFTDAVPRLAREGVGFVDVSGNSRIVLTVLAPANWTYDLPAGAALHRQDVVGRPDLERLVVVTPVGRLSDTILGLDRAHARIEHLFDY